MSAAASADEPLQAEAVFHCALELPVGERAAFVAEQCGIDATLHARVMRLLAAHDSSADFMATAVLSPASRVDLVQRNTEAAEECIGPYRLVEQIGEGGFGVVWLAEQDRPVRRQVALKIIRLGMDTEDVIARFGQERQALAVMDHPNIAKVFDAGATPSGRPFFVMELVRGVKITEYCDANGLSTQQRLELFVQVCHAVQHAHQKGIIHRDLKPSNILVETHDGQPVPKVIDFGVAKATGEERLAEETLRTRMEEMVGTPLYMSPEQASLDGSDIDTRSDIYSLGVLLYEILTGKPPFDTKTLMAAGFDEMRRIIREVDPPRPSTRLIALGDEDLRHTASLRASEPRKLTSVLRGDLDWIVMKALEKDRTRRYESANGLAMDIQRHLNSEPVVARPPTNGYRLRRWVRRNKLAFAAASSIIAALLLGIGLTTWQAVRATRAEQEQAQLRQTAETEMARSKQVSAFLQSTLAAVDPNIAAGRDTALLRIILDSAAQRVGLELKDQPEVEADLRTTIGDAYISIGEPEKGEQMHREALRLRQNLHGPESLDISQSLYRVGIALAHRSKHSEAEAMLRAALAMRRKLQVTPDAETASILGDMVWPLQSNGHHAEAVSAAREALEIRIKRYGEKNRIVSISRAALGMALRGAGDLPGAETEAIKALDVLRQLGGGNSNTMAHTLTGLGKIQIELSKFVEAEATLREAAEMMAAVAGRDTIKVADILRSLSEVLAKQNKLEEAEKVAREVVAIRHARQEPAHSNQYGALRDLETILRKRDDYVAAEVVARQIVELQRQIFGPNHQQVAEAMENLIGLLRKNGKRDEAEIMRREALEVTRKALLALPNAPDQQEKIVSMLYSLSGSFQTEGKWVEAEKVSREALAIRRKMLGNEHLEVATALSKLSYLLGKQNKLPEAESTAREALAIRRKLLGNEHLDVAAALSSLSGLLRGQQDKLPEAETTAREALAIRKKLLGNDHVDVASTLHVLAWNIHLLGRNAEAEALSRDEVRIRKKSLGDEHPYVAWTLLDLTVFLRDQGKFAEAEAAAREALAVRSKRLADVHPDVHYVLPILSDLLRAQGRLPEIEDLYREELGLQRKVFGQEHRSVEEALGNLAAILHSHGKLPEAETVWREELAMEKKLSGNDSLLVANSLDLLALVLNDSEKWSEAETVTREALALRRKLSPGDPLLAATLAELARALLSHGKFTEAEPVVRECLTIREKETPDGWPTFDSRSMLGGSLLGQKQYAGTEALLISSYEGLKQREDTIPAARRHSLKEALQRLVLLYEATGQAEKVAEWNGRLAAFDAAEVVKKRAPGGSALAQPQ